MATVATPPAIPNWNPALATTSPAMQRGRWWLVVALVVYAAVAWFVIVPHGIGYSWRECDTQAIARNFLLDGFDPFHPRVDWRGDTDGGVECEFPLYQLMIATAMALFGDVEWPGRVIALLSMLVAAVSLHRLLEMRSGPWPALAGTLVFLCGGHAMLLGSRVMPDAFSLALALAGLTTFARYLATGSRRSLWLAVAAITFAALQKTPSLQVLPIALGWTVLLARHRLRESRLWFGFAGIVLVVAVWLAHGSSLHATTGLTFGVLGNGDTKFPTVEHLLQPVIHAQLVRTTLLYGMSAFGVLGLFALLVQRRFDRGDAVLLGTVLLGLLGTLRYSYHYVMGPHYHVFAAVAGAWCVARAWPERAPRWLWPSLLVAVLAHGAWQVTVERHKAEACSSSSSLGLAASLRAISEPTDLTVLRADKPLFDASWRRRNNFEDPRLFYHAHRRGWILPADGFDAATLQDLRSRGARYVVDVLPNRTSPETAAWLAENGEVVLREAAGVVHRLRVAQ